MSTSLRHLNDQLTLVPILSLSDGHDNFGLYSDVLHIVLGCISYLVRGRVIVYASKQLKVHERNDPTHDLELATADFVLQIWPHYLYGGPFQL